VAATSADPLELLVEQRLVRVERALGEPDAAAERERPQGRHGEAGDRGDQPFLTPLLLPGVEILREVPLERAADGLAVGADLAQGRLDLLRQELRGQVLVLA